MSSSVVPSSKSPASKSPADAKLLRAVLCELEDDVKRRIAREEGIGGFFSFLSHAAPRYVGFIESLRTQHDDILRSLRELRRRAARGDDPETLAHDLEAVVTAIVEHEELEREALLDALEG